MKRHIEIAIQAVEAAKQAITRIRDRIPEGDHRLNQVEDAELGAAWIIKQLRTIEPHASEAAT